jgi:hypothetical protein
MLIEDAVLFELHKLCATFSVSVNINYIINCDTCELSTREHKINVY